MNEMAAETALPAAHADATPPACQNCGKPLLGPHCYHCGQPVDGLVRHFSSILGDFADSVLNIDARVFRTLWPLFAKPGYLSREYFAGRRVRYVSPVRLFVFLSIITFFIAQLVLTFGDDSVRFGKGDDVAATTAAAANPDEDDDETNISFNGRKWDAKSNPVAMAWLPDFANDWLNTQIGHGVENLAELKQHPERFKEAFVGAIPSTLFVLLPIFALMLKVLYLFKRRLYMEHLIVALHSHAFLCLALLLVFGLDTLGDAAPALAGASGLLEKLVVLWMPLYLLLMQKRVYAQGWAMTVLKYGVLGMSYMFLLSLGMAATVVASVVWL
jgi:hypothetical protein